MAELDLELDALFELSQPVTRLPRSGELMRLDDFFEADDYGISQEQQADDLFSKTGNLMITLEKRAGKWFRGSGVWKSPGF